jgi:hypothetical protein
MQIARFGKGWILIAAWILTPVLVLSACTGVSERILGANNQEEFYRPPENNTARPLLLPTATMPVAVDTPTAAVAFTTPACTNYLKYIEDVSIPDGTIVRPGEILDKKWLVENSGSCNWDSKYRLRLVAGSELGAPDEAALYPARSGTQATISLVFTAPDTPDTYRSAWQAYDPQGSPFGDPFFIEIVVSP